MSPLLFNIVLAAAIVVIPISVVNFVFYFVDTLQSVGSMAEALADMLLLPGKEKLV